MKKTRNNRFSGLRKFIAAIALATSVFVAMPQPAQASGAPTTVVVDLFAVADKIEKYIEKGLRSAAYVGFKNSVRVFFEQISYQTAVWLASGGAKQQPLVRLESVQTFVTKSGDAAAGEFLNTFLDESGFEKLNLCRLPNAQAVHLRILLPKITQKRVTQPDCTLTQIGAQFENRWEKAQAFYNDPTSLVKVSAGYGRSANALNITLEVWDKAIQEEQEAEEAATVEALKSDYKDQESKVGGSVETPAAQVEQQAEQAAEDATEAEKIVTGDVVADSVAIFTTTLASKLIQRYKSGFFEYITKPDIGTFSSGTYGGAVSSGAGIAGAQEKFASFQTPAFQQGGEIDIVDHLANCPAQGADVTNCVIDSAFQTAIREQKTVREALEQGPLNSTTEINLRQATILRRYSIVPAGWQIAAEYHEDFDQDGSLRLQDLVDQYDDCGEGDLYSPYCGLVDPDWVLKAPDVLCKLEGYGEALASDPVAIDRDGNEYTPDEYSNIRLNTCLDPQSCLSEDGNGNCLAYGYCTEQRRIYRFEGDSCPAHAASCTVFENENGDDIGYLTNTLNYNDCSADNAGCMWYCTEQDADGNYICSTPEEDNSIHFDGSVSTCPEGEVGCTEFIEVAGGSNLIMNPDFNQFNGERNPSDETLALLPATGASEAEGAFDDTVGFYGKNGGGAACTVSGGDQRCYGWEQLDNAGLRVAQDIEAGVQVAELKANAGYIQSSFNTTQPLRDRSFVLSFTSRNTSGQDSCTGEYWIEAAGDFTAGGVDRQAFTIEYPATSDYQQTSSGRITFGAEVDQTVVRVGITSGSNCTIAVDNVKLEENSGSSGYTAYGEQKTNVNVNEAAACSVDDVGCTQYIPQTGESQTPIAGKITNPYSDACIGPDGFASPECSQCQAEFIGCDAFIQEETPFAAPVKDNTQLTASATEETRNAVATRRGMYCDGTDIACNEDSDCASGLCLPSISIIPETGESCSAASVGCEEYTNLDSVDAGGEGLEYYKYIRQCVKPTTEQETNNEVETYYTFEGSDDTGYQIRSWELKKSNISSAESAELAGAPCTNLDLYGSSAQTPEANCVDTVDTMNTCSIDEVGNGECLEFYDSVGRTYYINQSATITVSEECVGLRNSLDGRTYYSIPSESESCTARDNLCREYKGSQADAAQIILEENFDQGAWGGEASGEVVTANTGFSMALGTSSTSQRGITPVSGLSTTESYVVTFWAKKSSDTDTTALKPMFVSNGLELYFSDVELSTEWRQYTAGPFAFENGIQGDEQFGFRYDGSLAYIDNVSLFENASHYLIHGTSDICHGYEGCEEYQDNTGETHYLKSFDKLCDDNAIGCQALINTNGYDLPYYEKFNTGNEFSNDDVEIGVHTVETYAVTNQSLCDSDFAGCTAYGKPSLDAQGAAKLDEYEEVYLVDDPDSYSSTLCQNQSVQCKEWIGQDGSVQYFKDPGDKLCQYNTGSGIWEDPDGNPCALANPAVSPSQPKGPVCSSDSPRAGASCNTDSDCRTSDSDPISARCISNEADSGYVGLCAPEYHGCTSYLDPNTDSVLANSDFETDSVDNANRSVGVPDGKPDNWSVPVDSDGLIVDNNFLAGTGNACASDFFTVDQAHAGSRALELRTNTGEGEHCMVAADQIEVNPNATYTLSGYVYAIDPAAEYSIGLTFYDSVGDEIAVPGGDAQNYAIAAYEGGNGARSNITVGAWQRFHASIGPGLVNSFPEDTYFVQAFVETGNNSQTVYFDDVELSENKEYTYINDSVDGAPESDSNSCSTGIDPGAGCVAVRDTTNDTLTYVSENDVATEACTFNTGDDNEACRSRVNSADTNVVVKVRNDRECAEWLACASEVRADNAEDGSLDCFETGNCSCIDIRKCVARNAETGTCTQWADSVDPDDLGYDDDVSVTSSPDDTGELESIQNVSGFATVGAEWVGAFCDTQSNSCIGGANHGQSCDTGCNDAISYGFYPYDWMPQVGLGGAATGSDPVKHGDFEEVYCNGPSDFDSESELSGNTALQNALSTSRDTTQKCTSDWHCRSPQLDALFQREDLYGGSTNVASIHYERGWCGNVGSETEDEWKSWETTGEARAEIIDYDNGETVQDYVRMSSVPGYESETGASIAAKSLDFSNFLYVEPQADGSAEGVKQVIDEGIAQGQEYVLSFDAAYVYEPQSNDSIALGLQHGDGLGDADYFEVGAAYADIVFIVDISSTMEEEIASVASNTTALVNGLNEAGLDYRVGIVTTGGSREPRAETFGESNFTASVDEFGDRMSALSGSLEGGSVFNYEAIKDVADNNLELDFRAGAIPFVVLLTDATPEGDDEFIQGNDSSRWDPDDETDFLQTFDGAPFTMYSIRSTGAADAYDQLTAQFGGVEYDLAGDYSVLLDELTADIDTKVSSFQFSTSIENYVLGPIMIENKEGGESSTLFIQETAESGNTPFVIDNISLKPALELNKENNPQTENATWLAGQECRAYPREDSIQCDYITDSGEIYAGWKGYCVEYDPADANKQHKKCLTWWPIDVIAGDTNNTGNIQQVQYNQKFPAYHCLVAKGNANLGACTDDGTICVNDADCGNGQCLGNGASTYTPTGEISDNFDVEVETGGYQVTHTISNLPIDRGFDDGGDNNSFSHEDPVDPIGSFDSSDLHEVATFQKMNPSRVEQLIHISEIDRLQFYLGTPGYVDNDDDQDQNGYEPEQAQQAWLMDGTSENGRYEINGFDTLSWEANTNGKLFASQYNRQATNEFPDERIEGQNLEEGSSAEADDAHGVFAIQTGAWCGNYLCDASSSQDSLNDADFIFVKGTTGYRNTEGETPVDRLKGRGRVFNDEDGDNLANDEDEAFNPFNEFDELWAESAIWGERDVIQETSEDSGTGKVAGVTFDKNYFQTRYPEYGTQNADASECFDTIANNELAGCGNNIVGVKFDFENGYLQNIYLFYWDAFHRFDAASMRDISWTYSLREPCLLVAEGADETAEATPWYNRIQQETRYRVNGIPYSHTMNGVNKLFGSIGGDDTPINQIDGISHDGIIDFTGKGYNLPYVFLNTAAGSALPFACIGDCGGVACQDEEWSNDYSEDSCQNNDGDSVWIGVPGVCQNLDEDNEAHFCNDEVDCSSLGLGSCVFADTGQTGSEGPGGTPSDGADDVGVPDSDPCVQNPQLPQCDSDVDILRAQDIGEGTDSGDGGSGNPGSGSNPGQTGDDTGTAGGSLGGSDTTAYTGGASSRSTSGTPGLTGAGSHSGFSTYLQQLNAATRIGWERYRQIFADTKNVWFANENANHNNRYQAELTKAEDLTSFCPDGEGFICDAFDQNTSDVATRDFRDNTTMNECSSSDRSGSDDYCGVRPVLENMTIDGESREFTIDNGDVVSLQFDSNVDPAQVPIEFVRIVWEGTSGTPFAEENWQQKTWGGASTDNYSFRHVYPCTFDRAEGGFCTYRIKVQIQDAWGFCSGDIAETVIRDENFAGSCTSYTEYEHNIRVRL